MGFIASSSSRQGIVALECGTARHEGPSLACGLLMPAFSMSMGTHSNHVHACSLTGWGHQGASGRRRAPHH